MAVLLLPIAAQAPDDGAQDVAGQMRHPHPGQDQETRVVGHPREALPTLLGSPADERVAGLALPGGRTKHQTGHRSTLAFTHQVAQVFTDAVALAQVVMALQQEPQQPGVRSAGTHRFDAQGSQGRQFGVERTLVQRRRRGLTVALAVDRGPLSRRQPDQPPGLELEQQRAARHVLEPSRRVAPPPQSTQFTGELRAMPGRMHPQQAPDLKQILIAELTAWNENEVRHRPVVYTGVGCELRTKWKNFRPPSAIPSPCHLISRPPPLARSQNENCCGGARKTLTLRPAQANLPS